MFAYLSNLNVLFSFLFLQIINKIKYNIAENIKDKIKSFIYPIVNLLITELILALWSKPALGLALLGIVLGFYLELYTGFSVGQLYIWYSIIYIYIHINYIVGDFQEKYPLLYLVLTLICIILIIYNPENIFQFYKWLVKIFSSSNYIPNGQGPSGGPEVPGPGGPGGPTPPGPYWETPDEKRNRKNRENRKKNRAKQTDEQRQKSRETQNANKREKNKIKAARNRGEVVFKKDEVAAMSIILERKRSIEQRLSELREIGLTTNMNDINRITAQLEQLKKDIKNVYT